MPFKEIDCKKISINPFETVSDEWFLLSAGNKDSYNAMTISWGHLGAIWGHGAGRPTAIVYVRPSRYTKEFIEKTGGFTLSLFPSSFKKKLGYLGSVSGRDVDKIKESGLTPLFDEKGVYYEEAKLVFFCKTIYQGKLHEEGFIDKGIIPDNYPTKDFHDIYIGEILKTLKKDN